MRALYPLVLALAAAALLPAPAHAGGTRVDYSSEFHSAMADLSMSPGEKYRVRVNVENKGARAWQPADVTLLARWSTGPGASSGIDEHGFEEKVPRVVSSNLRCDINGMVTGPSMPGDWTLTLRMALKGKPFGDTRTIKINVLTNYNPSIERIDLPARIQANRKYAARVRVKNAGQSDWDKDRLVLRVQVVKATGNNLNNFLGKSVSDFKLTKVVKAGESIDFLIPITAKASAEYQLSFYLWDLEERDEVGKPEPFKVTVQ